MLTIASVGWVKTQRNPMIYGFCWVYNPTYLLHWVNIKDNLWKITFLFIYYQGYLVVS